MKFKKLFSISFMFFPIIFASSCTNSYINKLNMDYKELAYKENDFDIFVQQNYINEILNIIFSNDNEAKKLYIESQKQLNNSYLLQVKEALRYANHITYSLNSTRNSFLALYDKAYTVKKAEEILDTFSSKNWLYYLYSFDKLVFIQDQEESGNDINSLAKKEAYDENILLYKNFYQAKNNRIIDYVIQNYSKDEYSEEINFYMLNNDGFIIRIIIEKNKDPDTNKLTTNVRIFGYLNLFPKLIAADEKKAIFDIKKYVQDTKTFANFNEYSTETNKVLFTDKYGGNELVYTLIDVN
ncbi:aromatic motif membrane protein [Mycoplasmopsis meleagridis]|uniref:aromatic motif membrane protein n=1 Tax=Mycoplasmopsis meleagridis TaxID=29561 RepID=UPI003A888577